MSEQTNPNDARPASDIYATPVHDGLVNAISGLGTSKARGPSSYLGYSPRLDRTELEALYRFYWIAKAVDIKPWDMTREWRTFLCDGLDNDKLQMLAEEERRLAASEKFRTALQWASLYGGGAVIMHVRGHGNISTPLDPTKIQRGQLERLSVADRWEIYPFAQTVDFNPLSPTYRTAEHYQVAHDTTNQKIHRSRIIFFYGREMPIRVTRQLLGWGESDVQRWYEAITQSQTLSSAIIEGVHQANVDVVKAAGLAQTLAMKGGEDKVKDRFMTMDYCKSLLNMVVVDGEDDFSRNAFPYSGLPELKRIFMEELSSATDIPVTRLLGSSPAGMNATGESDTRNYYDMIASLQAAKMTPQLYALDQVLVRSTLGDYPEGLRFEYDSLWQMTDAETAELENKQAATLSTLQTIGVPEDVLLKDAIEKGLVSNMTVEDVNAMEFVNEEEEGDQFGLEGNDDPQA